MEVEKITLILEGSGRFEASLSGDAEFSSGADSVEEKCWLELTYAGYVLKGVGDDFFDAFCRIREQLAEKTLVPVCYGASRNVYPSGMARDMGLGLKAYKLEMGRKPEIRDLVDIFETGPEVEPATVADQKSFADEWYKQGQR